MTGCPTGDLTRVRAAWLGTEGVPSRLVYSDYQGNDQSGVSAVMNDVRNDFIIYDIGRIVLDTDELFKEASWFSVLMGQGVAPGDYNPLVGVWDASDDLKALEATRRAIADQCARTETHRAALARFGASVVPQTVPA